MESNTISVKREKSCEIVLGPGQSRAALTAQGSGHHTLLVRGSCSLCSCFCQTLTFCRWLARCCWRVTNRAVACLPSTLRGAPSDPRVSSWGWAAAPPVAPHLPSVKSSPVCSTAFPKRGAPWGTVTPWAGLVGLTRQVLSECLWDGRERMTTQWDGGGAGDF